MGRKIVCCRLHESSLICISGSYSTSRPKSLKDVTAQDHTITVLQRTLQASNVGTIAPIDQLDG